MFLDALSLIKAISWSDKDTLLHMLMNTFCFDKYESLKER